MPTLRRWFKRLRSEDDGQDLTEYTLLIGFLALAAVGVMSQLGVTAQGPWVTAQTTLSSASTAPGSQPTTPPPSDGRGDRDHDNH
jgi:Flp pilus assembly pilin Flp